MISAKVVEDSVSPVGYRITTLELTFHRYILAELNTHCDFSRNSASSRARSVSKTLQEVSANIAYPPKFPQEKIGMVGGPSIKNVISAEEVWTQAAHNALYHARDLINLGVHKSVVNRLLEPFMWHTAVVTATEWDNFFDQRLALKENGIPEADPAMYLLAVEMKKALDSSTPTKINYGNWHLPYVSQEERARFGTNLDTLKKLSVARCAGVSYLSQNANREHNKDLELFNRLKGSNHWSPFEHVAMPSHLNSKYFKLKGWASYRWTLQNKSWSVHGT